MLEPLRTQLGCSRGIVASLIVSNIVDDDVLNHSIISDTRKVNVQSVAVTTCDSLVVGRFEPAPDEHDLEILDLADEYE